MPRSLYMLGFDLDEYLVLPPFKDVFQVILCNKLLTNRTWYQLNKHPTLERDEMYWRLHDRGEHSIGRERGHTSRSLPSP